MIAVLVALLAAPVPSVPPCSVAHLAGCTDTNRLVWAKDFRPLPGAARPGPDRLSLFRSAVAADRGRARRAAGRAAATGRRRLAVHRLSPAFVYRKRRGRIRCPRADRRRVDRQLPLRRRQSLRVLAEPRPLCARSGGVRGRARRDPRLGPGADRRRQWAIVWWTAGVADRPRPALSHGIPCRCLT